MDDVFESALGRASLLTLSEVRALECWRDAFAHLAKDHRYYEIVDETLRPHFEFFYLCLETPGDGVSRAIQPVFVFAQDLLLTAPRPLRVLAAAARRLFPGFLRLRMLMAGCAAGEGHPAGAASQWSWVARLSAEALPEFARRCGARMVIWKDWPARYRDVCGAALGTGGFLRVPSMPASRLTLRFEGFEDYMRRHLSHAMRKNLRRKFKATRGLALEMSVVHDVSGVLEEVHALYEQVFARSPLKLERLSREFFLQLGEKMPDRVRFFLWRRAGVLVACSLCLVHEGALYDEYLGLDYSVALDWHLYFVTLRDVLSWAMENGFSSYHSTPLNYDPKLHLGFELAPLDLYVAGVSPWTHALLRRLLPWIEPTRGQPILAHFPNAADLHGDAPAVAQVLARAPGER